MGWGLKTNNDNDKQFINTNLDRWPWLTVDYLIASLPVTSASTRQTPPWLRPRGHSYTLLHVYVQITYVNSLLPPDAYFVFSDY